jgi:hypothetical protein
VDIFGQIDIRRKLVVIVMQIKLIGVIRDILFGKGNNGFRPKLLLELNATSIADEYPLCGEGKMKIELLTDNELAAGRYITDEWRKIKGNSIGFEVYRILPVFQATNSVLYNVPHGMKNSHSREIITRDKSIP